MVAPDFRVVFESLPGCYLVLSPELQILAVSDPYLRATLTTREQLLGRGLFEAFPDNPDDPEATGVANLKASLQTVLSEHRAHEMTIQKYDIRRPESEGGGFEERYWKPVNSPVFDASGRIQCIVHQVEDVTPMMRLEKHGREQDRRIQELSIRGETQLRQLLDAAPDAMLVVGSDARIRFINAQAEQLFGYASSELLGRDLDLLVPSKFHVAHVEHLRRFFREPRARSMGSGLELYARRKDGKEVPIEVSLSPLLLEEGAFVTAAIRDVTERKRIEAAANLLASRLASAVESIQDAFALFDETDHLVLCNSAYRRLVNEAISGPLVGLTYEHILSAWLPQLDLGDEKSREAFFAERRAQRSEPHVDFKLRTVDGRSLRVIDQRTPEGGMVKTIWDLTEDARIAAELKEARVAAEAASAAKSEFLSSMSHELRTPLNAILGFAQLLCRDKKQPPSERQLERIRHILDGGEHLLKLIDDILDLSRIEAGRVSVSIEPVDVNLVLQELRTTLGPSAAASEISLVVPTAASPPILADRTRFTQILMNFGSNAVKYNRPGGRVTFEVSEPAPDVVRITVADTGLGIPSNKQGALFQPFQRAGQENGPIEGTGIGLAISKRLAEAMGGTVGFHSEHGVGSRFWIEMPVHATHAPSSSPPKPRRGGEYGLERKEQSLVLYVEDNPANVRFMEELLSAYENLELIVARTAEEGLEIARARRPRVIILDINLPGMSGLDALRVLRDRPETARTPVIALSAAASELDQKRGKLAGFASYLTKPLRVDEFESALSALLN
ncbi:MAG TPA: PAS domain S-box protein [Polyangiaceae bacterium]|nr:PAS domain S-box protein [Polyangiaceae bacterium]